MQDRPTTEYVLFLISGVQSSSNGTENTIEEVHITARDKFQVQEKCIESYGLPWDINVYLWPHTVLCHCVLKMWKRVDQK